MMRLSVSNLIYVVCSVKDFLYLYFCYSACYEVKLPPNCAGYVMFYITLNSLIVINYFQLLLLV